MELFKGVTVTVVAECLSISVAGGTLVSGKRRDLFRVTVRACNGQHPGEQVGRAMGFTQASKRTNDALATGAGWGIRPRRKLSKDDR